MAPSSFQIVQRTGPTPGKIFSLTKNEVYVGRDITNDIVINDPEVSRKHARLTLQSGGYVLEDLGSTNGTFIDGQRITGPHLMVLGEVIMLGDNVTLAFDTTAIDPDATVAVSPEDVPIPSAPPPASTAQPPAYQPPPAAYQPPPGPPASTTGPISGEPAPTPEAAPAPRANNQRIWLLAGCGCIVLFLCVVAAGLVAFDSLNLWCTPPFDVLFACP